MENPFNIAFTDSFWRSAECLGLNKKEILEKSKRLEDNPFIGKAIGNQSSLVRSWEVNFTNTDKLNWYFIIDEGNKIVENVFLTTPETIKNKGEELIIFARIIEIALRIFGE